MLTLSLREFQLKASKYIDKLPITLTVYGKPVAIVNRFDVMISNELLEKGDIETIKKIGEVTSTIPEIREEKKTTGPIMVTPSNLGKILQKISKAPRFCSKHRGQLIGEKYTCGCPL